MSISISIYKIVCVNAHRNIQNRNKGGEERKHLILSSDLCGRCTHVHTQTHTHTNKYKIFKRKRKQISIRKRTYNKLYESYSENNERNIYKNLEKMNEDLGEYNSNQNQ